MKKIFLIIIAAAALAACAKCETEPIVEQNHKLIIPPHIAKR